MSLKTNSISTFPLLNPHNHQPHMFVSMGFPTLDIYCKWKHAVSGLFHLASYTESDWCYALTELPSFVVAKNSLHEHNIFAYPSISWGALNCSYFVTMNNNTKEVNLLHNAAILLTFLRNYHSVLLWGTSSTGMFYSPTNICHSSPL